MRWLEAAQNGDVEELDRIVRTGANVNSLVDDAHGTPLHYVAAAGHAKALQFLLSQNAVIDSKDKYGRTPLYMAVLRRQAVSAEILLDNKANPDAACQCGTTAVSKAAEHGDVAILELLLQNSARIDTENIDGETPEDLAQHNGHDAVLARFRYYKTQRLRSFWKAAQRGSVTEMRRLVDSGVNAQGRDLQGHSALDLAAQNGHREAVLFLLHDVGVNAAEANSRGITALHWAAQHGHEAVVDLLLEYGAPLDAADRTMMRPLHRAAERGHDAVINTIWNHRNQGEEVNLDILGPNGVTPLMLAARHGRKTTVQLLLHLGADPSLEDGRGETARAKAWANGHADVMNLL
ncbi:hypothetical protein VTN77DRAFT_1112 [Rasamsonia byssochlamydoides]|uniref:uncharacterized protein n=1 Tax=Rasamsonia byssochlamydoides TaxID=89139 RepID=UPI0037444678